jgi:ribosomal protein L7Ae-like RNA K-turn-binding protein
MRRHLGSLFALARKAGALVIGFTKTEAGLRARRVKLLIAAHDGAADGRRKLAHKAKDAGIGCFTLLSSDELGMALGQSNVIHAGLTDVGWAKRINRDAGRLAAYLGDTEWETE